MSVRSGVLGVYFGVFFEDDLVYEVGVEYGFGDDRELGE